MDKRNNISPSPSSAVPETASVQEALRVWVQRHKQVIDVLLDAFVVVDSQNRVVDFNVAFSELCGESYRKTLKIGDFCKLLKMERCPDGCPAREVIITGRPIRLDEVKACSSTRPELELILGGVPIFADDEVTLLGAMLTIRDVSAEMALQKKYVERKEDSVTDGLTRLYNKVYTESMLLKFINSTVRESSSISVVMCDIDHFKRVNDTYGHQAGDFVLARVAHLLMETSRESDVVGRFGGEEFVAVLPMTSLTGAKIFAERFRQKVEQTRIEFQGKHIPITASLGVSTQAAPFPVGADAKDIMKQVVAQADTALYFAKANGRNQSVQFESLPKGSSMEAATEAKRKKAAGER